MISSLLAQNVRQQVRLFLLKRTNLDSGFYAQLLTTVDGLNYD